MLETRETDTTASIGPYCSPDFSLYWVVIDKTHPYWQEIELESRYTERRGFKPYSLRDKIHLAMRWDRCGKT